MMEYPPKFWLEEDDEVINCNYHLINEQLDNFGDFIEFLLFIKKMPREKVGKLLSEFLYYSRMKKTCKDITNNCGDADATI